MIRKAWTVDLIITGEFEHVSFWLAQLDRIATLSDVTGPFRTAHGLLTVHATICRTVPMTGGPR